MKPGLPELGATRDAIRQGQRRAVAQAITLIESSRSDKARLGQALLEELIPYTGSAMRIGVTGPPGVGKSTFIEALGLHLLREEGRRVAVLAVDPSSPVSGGSILGDKTRMTGLAQHPDAFVRPSPSGGSLGGVARRTRESMMICEAAGFDVVIVETVGIGQSEVAVASMVDFFLVLLLPGGGDELQGIKKGVMELADALVVNKADGDTRAAAERTRAEYAGALELIRSTTLHWKPRALLASALTKEGVEAIWELVVEHRALLEETGEFQTRRKQQSLAWMWELLEDELHNVFRADPGVREATRVLEQDVQSLKTTPAAAARVLLAAFRGR